MSEVHPPARLNVDEAISHISSQARGAYRSPGRSVNYASDPAAAAAYRRNALSRSSNNDQSYDCKRRLSHSPVSVNTTYELG